MIHSRFETLRRPGIAGLPLLPLGVALAMAIKTQVWAALGPAVVAVGDTVLAYAACAMLCGLVVYYARWRAEIRIAWLIGSITVLSLNGIALGKLAMLGVAAGFPLVDPTLAAIDEAFGIDHRAIIGFFAAHPTVTSGLVTVYEASVPLVFGVAILLALVGQYARLSAYVSIYALTLAGSVVISIVCPAIGTWVHYDLLAVSGGRMPQGSGLYHLEVFNGLRSGREFVLSPLNLEGVVTFPSFHMCMGLLIAYGMWGVRGLRAIGVAIAVATTIATVPIGGHYIVDLVAGGMIFWLAARLVRPAPAVAVRVP